MSIKHKPIDMAVLVALAASGAIVMNDTDIMAELQDELLNLNERAEAIQAKADAEKRELTADESKELEEIFAEFEGIEANIERRKRIDAQTQRLASRVGRQTDPTPPGGSNHRGGDDPEGDDPDGGGSPAAGARRPQRYFREPIDHTARGRWGWNHFGEFAVAVHRASQNGGSVDPRLVQNAPTTYSSEGAGADGGFLVPPDFRNTIMEKIMAEASLLSRTDQMTSDSNTVILPKDETTNWQASGGVQAYWEGEADQFTQSKVALKSETHRLNKLTALVPVTDELFEDAPALDAYLRRKVPTKFDFKINDAIINGTGAGMPLGFMNSGALITVAKESGQAADTLVFENITNMYSRMYAPSRGNAIWLINQDIEPQLYTLQFPGSAGTIVPAYLPPGGLSAAPYGTIMGRPVIFSEAMQTLGDLGDIALVDLTQYLTIMKTAGIRADVSMHLWFDYATLAYRFIMRIAGKPWLSAPVQPKNGTTTHSPFVTLAARA